MTDDQGQIRQIFERWVEAIRSHDLDGVLAAHSDDIVMFDAPPPYEGIRGIDAYGDSWPPFFEFLAAGAMFEVVELEVVAGGTVGFAHALLRCGRPEDFAGNPDVRLRITTGFRKVDGEWTITHEHHSFPMTG